MQKNKGFTRIVKAAYYSYKGLSHAAKTEAAFQQELIAALVFLPLAFWLNVSTIERILLVGAVVLVMIVELLNTGIEAVVDRTGEEFNELSGIAKDMGSAAVMVAIVLASFIWVSITWPMINF